MTRETAGAPLWERPFPLGTLCGVLLVLGGVTLGALGWGPLTAVVLGLLLLLLVGACVLLVRSMNHATARETGVPYDKVFPLSRSLQKERIPHDAAGRGAMRLLIAKHRRSMAGLHRFRWAYAVLGALFLFGSVRKFLDGELLIGAAFLAGALGQLIQPLAQRQTVRRLDRVEAALDTADARPDPSQSPSARPGPHPAAEK